MAYRHTHRHTDVLNVSDKEKQYCTLPKLHLEG